MLPYKALKYFSLIIFLLVTASCTDNDNTLRPLDKAVEDNSSAVASRQSRIDSLITLRKGALSTDSSYNIEMQLSKIYMDFNVDSALLHVNRALELSPEDSFKRTEALLRLAGIYNSSLMMYKEASDIFDSLDSNQLPDSLKSIYFTLGVQLYRNLEELSSLSSLSDVYRRNKMAYRDSVLKIDGESPFILANKLADEGDYDAAIDIISRSIDHDGYSSNNGAAYHQLANLYSLKNDRQNTLYYLRLASQADLENGVREYKALPQLALMLYEDGDIEHAHRYIHRAFEDAKASNARLRMLELSSVMPIVDSAYEMNRRQATRTLIIITIAILVITLMLVEVLRVVRKRNKILKTTRSELLDANTRLTEANAVKEKYVTQFMHLSLDYLGKMERYRAELFKLANLKDYDRLVNAINTGRYINREMDDFYHRFDEAFLQLFPNFIERINSLLRPDEQIVTKKNELLNTELRIFALMKLGITDGEKLANFLRCSQSTIYNYRTKIRNRAIHRETFDQDLEII